MSGAAPGALHWRRPLPISLTMVDARRAPRIPLRQFVTYELGGLTMRGKSLNLSENGIFLETSLPADAGARLRLRFDLDGRRIQAEGVVVRSSHGMGMGIEFTRISEDHKSVIRNAVDCLAGELAHA